MSERHPSAPSDTSPPGGERRRLHGGKPVGIALLGCGTVGGGVLTLLARERERLAARVGAPLEVRRVLVRDPKKVRVEACDVRWVTTDVDAVMSDPEVELVVEVMGGEGLAGDLVERALRAGKSVVTANKALLAARGKQLFALAAEHRADLGFEAAVGGGIPIIRALRDQLAGDRVERLFGILNGTSNFVLTQMTELGQGFAEALADAQARGYAEADPTLDVGGFDAAHKLLVLATLAFGAEVTEGEIAIEGIRELEAADIEHARRLGYVVKHLVVGRDHGDAIELRVHPTLIPRSSVLANVSGVLNAVKIEGAALGPCVLSGRGAGDLPTAVSVVADVIDVSRAIVAGAPGLVTRSVAIARRPLRAAGLTEVRWYLRFPVADRPGVIAKLAAALGDAGVSIEQIEQGPPPAEGDAPVDVVIVTRTAREDAIRRALAAIELGAIEGQPFVRRAPRALRIEEP
jgi:homoserine dehydrogenase